MLAKAERLVAHGGRIRAARIGIGLGDYGRGPTMGHENPIRFVLLLQKVWAKSLGCEGRKGKLEQKGCCYQNGSHGKQGNSLVRVWVFVRLNKNPTVSCIAQYGWRF